MRFNLKKMSRTSILAWALILAFSAIIVRLFQHQIVDNAKYLALADAEQMKKVEVSQEYLHLKTAGMPTGIPGFILSGWPRRISVQRQGTTHS